MIEPASNTQVLTPGYKSIIPSEITIILLLLILWLSVTLTSQGEAVNLQLQRLPSNTLTATSSTASLETVMVKIFLYMIIKTEVFLLLYILSKSAFSALTLFMYVGILPFGGKILESCQVQC